MPRLGRLANATWPAILLTLPFLIGAVQVLHYSGRPFFTYGDQALIDLSVQRAMHFDALLGPYSRFGWNHPGPLYYYLLALFAWPIQDTPRIYFATLVLNWLSVMVMVALVVRSSMSRRTVAWFVVVSSVFLYALGPFFLRDPWNPSIIVLPLMACVVAVAVRPSLASTLVLTTGASIAVQSHVGTVAPVATVIVIAITLHVLGTRRHRWLGIQSASEERTDSRSHSEGPHMAWLPSRRSCLTVAASIILLWLPAIVEQLSQGREGNLGRVAHFFLTGQGDERPLQPLSKAFDLLAGACWIPSIPWTGLPPEPPIPGIVIVTMMVLVATVCSVVAWRRRQRAALVFCAVAALGLPVAGLGISRITGDVYVYLLWWIPVLPISLLVGAGLIALGDGGVIEHARRRWQQGVGLAITGAAGLVAVELVVSTLHAPSPLREERPEVREAWAIISPRLPPDHGRSILVDAGDPSTEPYANGIALELSQHGYRWVVPPDERATYGMMPAKASRSDVTILLTATGSATDVANRRPSQHTTTVPMAIRVYPSANS